MLLSVFVRLSLWVFLAFVVVAVVALLTTDIGLVDWAFGTDARTYLYEWVAFFRSHYRINRANIELALKVIGLAGTVTFGMLGLVHAWHYGRINLPLRLAQYADRIRALHIEHRSLILAPYASRNLKGDHTPPLPIGASRRAVEFLGLDARSRSLRRLIGSKQSLDGDILVLSAKLKLRASERITAHLVDGLKLAAEAKLLVGDSAAKRAKNEAALAEFEKALKLDDMDLDALELVAKQARFVSSKAQTLRALIKMEAAAQDKRSARYARALRLHAEFIVEHSRKKSALRDARMKLEAALDVLTEKEDGTEKPFELALVNEQLARLHLRRNTLTLVEPYLDDADKLYEALPPPEGPAGQGRIERVRAELARAQLGGDDPGDHM